ncbi:MAG: 2-C-methyl-D-erythritol 4-phosphate cytidylyltransferase [Oligoflexia bacterium]|nr:2-C-methyl-D-erythritol 4-phosphate cytidylyltransferase [Oligoflexia bacterium]
MKCDLVLVAGGASHRFGLDIPKQFQTVVSKPLYLWSLEVFLSWKALNEVVIVVPQDWLKAVQESFNLLIENKKFHIVSGGNSRSASTYEGLKKLSQISDCEWVAVHDAARPCITTELIESVWNQCVLNQNDPEFGGAVPGTRVNETIKVVKNSIVTETLNRNLLYTIQTPQILRQEVLVGAMSHIDFMADFVAFDDASLIEKMGRKIVVVESTNDNLKVTHQEDIERVQNWLRKRHPQI